MKALLVAVNAKYIHSNLAVYSLMKNAEGFSEHMELCEYTINHQMDRIVRDIYARRPEVLFFSCYIWNIEYVRDAAREIHKLLPEVPIWFGGPEVSYDGEEIFSANPCLTGVMHGEGEETFAELMHYYVYGGNLCDISGISYREGENIYTTGSRILKNMDSLSFVYDDLERFQNKIIYYESSRGCPFHCSYCMSSIDKTVRFRSFSLVFSELQFFLDHQVPQVKFIDRTFNIQVERTVEILKYLASHDNGITNFHFEVAADIITEEEIAIMQKLRPGYIQLEIGVQSTNPETIKEINRKMDFEKVCRVVRSLKKENNMHIHLDLIAGLPFEDMESFIRSFNDVYALLPHELQLGFLKVLKGAGMHERAGEYGIVYGDKAPYEVLRTRWLSFDDIIRLKAVEEMVEIYYNSGLFCYTLNMLEGYFENAFAMYDRLAEFYKKNNLLELHHNRITRYEILKDFMEEYAAGCRYAGQVLLFDLYLHENLKTRPGFAYGLQEYKTATRELYRKYAVPFSGKDFHIEPFDIDICGFVKDGQLREKKCCILFDYSEKHAVTRQARIMEAVENV